METTTKQKPSVIERLAKFNLSIQCSPPSGGVDGDWPHIAYAVTLSRNGKAFWAGPYKLGVGHVKIPNPDRAFRVHLTIDEASMCYTLNRKPNTVFKNKALQSSLCAKLALVQKI